MQTAEPRRWLLLAHQLPPKAAYLRVKLWRQLRESGAVPLKHALYILPVSPARREGFRRLLKELELQGGEGAICEASFVEGMNDSDIESLFRAAREVEYQRLAKHLRSLTQRRRGKDHGANLKLKVGKARHDMRQIAARDFFGASGREVVEQLLSQLEHSPILRTEPQSVGKLAIQSLAGKVWVTRRDVHVDRIACAWLILRFVDRDARFAFVSERRHKKARGRLGFDMAGAEFTHEGDKCSFEVLAEHVRPADVALKAIAEIIHDLDLKDRKFCRGETEGIGQAIEGICAGHARDLDRIAQGGALCDDLYDRFVHGRHRGRKPKNG